MSYTHMCSNGDGSAAVLPGFTVLSQYKPCLYCAIVKVMQRRSQRRLMVPTRYADSGWS